MKRRRREKSDFAQFLVKQVPVFDEMIMADIRLPGGWVSDVELGSFLHADSDYYKTLAAVRFLSENAVNRVPRETDAYFKMVSEPDKWHRWQG